MARAASPSTSSRRPTATPSSSATPRSNAAPTAPAGFATAGSPISSGSISATATAPTAAAPSRSAGAASAPCRPLREQLIFTLQETAAADALVAAFREASVAIADNHGFAGAAPALARLRTLTQAGWVLDPEASEACLAEYRRIGWLGLVPERCQGATLILPRQGGWTLWGWPYRFLDRMAGARARFLMLGAREGDTLIGLERPEQLGEVPRHYRGLLLIEDMHDVGRALQR
jgi:hypothetical protein